MTEMDDFLLIRPNRARRLSGQPVITMKLNFQAHFEIESKTTNFEWVMSETNAWIAAWSDTLRFKHETDDSN